jgi:uncharacterized protein YbjQ (UPF0145 family)
LSFTSDLTIDEVLLVEEAGFEPVDLVMGSSYYHVGYQYAPWSQNQELTDLSRLMILARHDALRAVHEQVAACGADGVVGVRLDIEREGHHAEFTAVGTAVRRRDGKGAAFRAARGVPFTCDLSGEDFWALIRGGFRPVSLVMGACVYHVAHQGLGAWLGQIGTNVEHVPFTQGLYDARELAMERMQGEAQQAGASGVVAVDVHEGHYGWDAHVIEYFAVGTAVAPILDEGHEVHAPPRMVMSVGDPVAR